MSYIGQFLYDRLKARYGDNKYRQLKSTEAQYSHQIELEYGECFNVKGFQDLSNKINTRRFNIHNFLYFLLLEHLKRIGNIYIYVMYVLSTSVSNEENHKQRIVSNISIEDSLLFLMPMLLQLLVLTAKNLYFDRMRHFQDNIVNERLVTVFKEMKKFINQKPETIIQTQVDKNSLKQQKQEEFDTKQQQTLGKKLVEPLTSMPRKNSSVPDQNIQDIKNDRILNNTLKKSTANNPINNNQKKRQERVPIFENLRWDQIKVGDIVYLKKGELAPADLLILDSCENKIQINSINIDGRLDEQTRFCSPLTRIQKNQQSRPSGFDYKKILNGFIKYDRAQDLQQKYRGFIKLKKDPKGESFDDQQVIFREEQLKFQSYVYGLVIFAGNECWCNKQIKNIEKQSFFLSKSTMFFCLSYLTCISMSLLSWLIDAFQICQNNVPAIFVGQTYLFFLLKYTRLMPIYFYLCIDMLSLINARIKFRKYELLKQQSEQQVNQSHDQNVKRFRSIQKNSEPRVNYKQLNNFCVADLVMTEYICFSKTGTLTSGYSKVKAILIEDKFYKFSEKIMSNNQWGTIKQNYDNLVKRDSQYKIREIEEKSQFDEEEDRAADKTPRKKKTFQLFNVSSKRTYKQGTNILQSQVVEDSTKYSKHTKNKKLSIELDNKSVRSQISTINRPLQDSNHNGAASPELIEDAPENLKMDYLDDTHCKITPEQKNNKPLPFFNKTPLTSQIFLNQIHIQSPNVSQVVNQPFLIKNDSDEQELIDSNIKIIPQQLNSVSMYDNERRKQKDEDELIHLKQDDFYQSLANSSRKQLYQEALLSIVLCHSTKTKYNASDDSFQYEYQISLEQELLYFASHFDIQFICSNEHQNKTFYIIQVKEKFHEFQILAVNHYSSKLKIIYIYRHPRLAVLVSFPENLAEEFGLMMDESQDGNQFIAAGQCTVLIVREEMNVLPHYIEMDKFSRDYWGKVFQKMHVTGLRTIVYSKSYLIEQDKINYLEKFEVLKQQTDQDELLNLYMKIEKDMQIIQVVGVQETLKPDVPMTVNELKQAQIKVWLLSGDDQNKVLPCAYSSRILDTQDHQVVIDEISISEIKIIIRNHLQLMNNQLKAISKQNKQQFKQSNTDYAGGAVLNAVRSQFEMPEQDQKMLKSNRLIQSKSASSHMKPFSIILNGKSLQVISEDSSLLCHFSFILYFSNSLVAYNVTAQQKAYLVHLIHSQFPGNKRVLAVGSAINDIQMLQAADFGIQVEREIFNPVNKQINQLQNQKKSNKSQPKFGFANKQSVKINPVRKVFEFRSTLNIPTVELMIFGMKDLLGLIFFEARIFAEVIDDLLMFTFYRSLVLVYTIVLYNLMNCSFHMHLYDYIDLIFFQSFYLLIIQIANLFHKQYSKIGSKEQIKLYSLQFMHNTKLFKKKKILAFLLKISGQSLCDATIQYFLLINISSDIPDASSGRIMTQVTLQQIAKVNFLMIDMVKVFISANFTPIIKLGIFISYFTVFIAVSIVTSYVDKFSKDNLTVLLTNQGIFFMYLGYLFISVQMNLIIENTIKSFFSSPLVQCIKDFKFILSIIKVNSQKSELFYLEKKTKIFMRKAAIIQGKLFNNRDDCDINIQQMVSETTNQSSEKMNPLILNFQSTDTESKYRRLTKVVWFKFERRKQLFMFLTCEVMTLVIRLSPYQNIKFDTFLILNTVFIVLMALLQCLIASMKYEKHFFMINKISVGLRTILNVIEIFSLLGQKEQTHQLLIQQLYLFIIMFTRVSFPIMTISAAVFYTIIYTIVQGINNFEEIGNYLILNYMTLIVISSIIYKLTFMERQDFILETTLLQETQSNNNVLSILLPKFIRDRINQQGVFDFQENQGDVSLMFCDICNFDNIVAVENEKIVNLLDNLFRAFDLLCLQNGMQKIETVGKTYMAAGGLKAVDQNTRFQNINSVKRAINLSLEMMDYVKNNKFGEIGSIELKIGVHYGRVIAGVIGHHKPQFSLIGDTVNTTSRVCSTGVDGEITISQEAHEMVLMPELVFNKRIVNAKGKGFLTTYQVSKQGKRTSQKKILRGVIPKRENMMNNMANERQEEKSPNHRQSRIDQSQEQEMSDKKLSSRLVNILGEKKELIQSIQRIVQRAPTLIGQQPSLLNEQFLSNQNLEYPSGSHKQIIHARGSEIEESTTDKQNQIKQLEFKLRRDIIMDNVEDNPEYEVEVDKVKIQFMNDEGDISEERGEILELDPKMLYLGFQSHQYVQVQEFYKRTADIAFSSARFTLITTLISHSLKTLLTFIYRNFINDSYLSAALVVRICSSLVILIYLIILKQQRQISVYTEKFIIMLFFSIFLGNALESISLNQSLQQIQAAEVLLLISQFSSFEIVKIANRLFLMIIFIISYSLWLLIRFSLFGTVYYMLLWGFCQFLLQYMVFRSQINTFNNKINLEKKKSQSINLIMYLLPMHVLDKIKQNSYSVGHVDQLEEATLLFADIAGFTDYSSKVEPEQVVNMLRNLFTEFDKTCLIKNTYKLYTIGDCYVAVGVVNAHQRDPAKEAKNVVEMGFIMIDIIEQVRRIIGFDGLDMRIGIHTGHLIGGILGTDIVRYDIYGSDVMIANKMESNGEKGRVQVSDETKLILEQNYPDDFTFEFNKIVEFSSIKRKTSGWFVLPNKMDSGSLSLGNGFGLQQGYLDVSIRQVDRSVYVNSQHDPEVDMVSLDSPVSQQY